ncbi:phage tail assembly chaperone [Sphingomonas sp. ID1715]|nr:phage tail assembly chaperone [Sphingomonas sp. ID1715]
MTCGAQGPHSAQPRRAESPSPAGGEARFAANALRLSGLAGVLLGWRPGEFWEATPAELAAVFAALRPPGEAIVGEDELVRLKERFPDA